jgi:hypothetical protein
MLNLVGINPAKAGIEAAAPVVEKAAAAAGSGLGKAAAGSAETAYKGVGGIAEQLSDVPKEALASYGFGIGKDAKMIQKYAGKQHEIADEILQALDKYDEHMPEGKAVAKSLQKMPPINVGNAVKRLQAAKETIAGTPSAKEGNKQIDKMIESIVSVADENGNLAAKDFKRVREQIDNDMSAAFNKDYKSYIENAGLNVRNQMMDDLIASAEQSGNPEYASNMKEWARKLQIAEKLKGYIGKSPEARERHIDTFVKNIFNVNKERAREALAALGDVVDNNLLEKAKYTAMASQLGANGKPGLFSPIKTGTTAKMLGLGGTALYAGSTGNIPGLLAAGGGVALASPMIASKILSPLKALSEALTSRFKVPPEQAGKIAETIAQEAEKKRLPLSSMSQDELFTLIGKSKPEAIESQQNPFWNLPKAGSVEEKAMQATAESNSGLADVVKKIAPPATAEVSDLQDEFLKNFKSDMLSKITDKQDKKILSGEILKDKSGNLLTLSEDTRKKLQSALDGIRENSQWHYELRGAGLDIPEHIDDLRAWIQESPVTKSSASGLEKSYHRSKKRPKL